MWKRTLPTAKYSDRDVSDPWVAFRTVFEIDTRDADKQKCFYMMEDLLNTIHGMPEMMEQCAIEMTEISQAGEKDWKAYARSTLEQKIRELSEAHKEAQDIIETISSEDSEEEEAPEKPVLKPFTRKMTKAAKEAATRTFEAELEAWELAYGELVDPKHTKKTKKHKKPKGSKKELAETAEFKAEIATLKHRLKNDTFTPDEEREARTNNTPKSESKVRAARTWEGVLRKILITSVKGTIDSLDYAKDEMHGIIIGLINNVNTEGGDYDLAVRLQTRTRMMAWFNKLFVKNPEMQQQNMKTVGELTIKKFLEHTKIGKASWAHIDVDDVSTVMDEVIKKIQRFRRHGISGDQDQHVNAITARPKTTKPEHETTKVVRRNGNYSEVMEESVPAGPKKSKHAPKPAAPRRSTDSDADDALEEVPVHAVTTKRREIDAVQSQPAPNTSERDLLIATQKKLEEATRELSRRQRAPEQNTFTGRGRRQTSYTNIQTFYADRKRREPERTRYSPRKTRRSPARSPLPERRKHRRSESPRSSRTQQSKRDNLSSPQQSLPVNMAAFAMPQMFQQPQFQFAPPAFAPPIPSFQPQVTQQQPFSAPQSAQPPQAEPPVRQPYASRSSTSQNGALCRYQPCTKPECRYPHAQNQHKPDNQAFARTTEFSKQNYCRWDHDSGGCRGCGRQHGKCNQSAEKCAHIDNGICHAYFTREGCNKSHRRA